MADLFIRIPATPGSVSGAGTGTKETSPRLLRCYLDANQNSRLERR